MAYVRANWQKSSSSLNDAEPRDWTYSSTTDTLADTQVSGYFNAIINETNINDSVYIRASDNTQLFKLGPMVGDDITLSIPTQNYLNLTRNFTTVGVAAESYSMVVPVSGNIVNGSLQLPNGSVPTETFTFDLVIAGGPGSQFTLNIPDNQAIDAFFQGVPSVIAPVNAGDSLFWQKAVSGNFQVDFLGSVVIETA